MLTGATLKDQIGQLIASGIIAPFALTGIAFFYFWLRSSAKLYDARTDELRKLRRTLGIPTDDLEPKRLRQKPLNKRIEDAILWGVLAILLCVVVVGSWHDRLELNDLKKTLGASSRYYSSLVSAAHALRRDDSMVRNLAEHRRILIEGKDKKGGYKAEIAKLKGELEGPKHKAQPTAPLPVPPLHRESHTATSTPAAPNPTQRTNCSITGSTNNGIQQQDCSIRH
jgi:hypothetical protein